MSFHVAAIELLDQVDYNEDADGDDGNDDGDAG